MQAEIEVTLIEAQGKYPKVHTVGGGRFGVSPALATEINKGDVLNVEYTERTVTNPNTGKDFKAKDITAIVSNEGPRVAVKQAETPKIASNGKEREDSIKKLSEAKNDNIARCAALNNALEMVRACCESGSLMGMDKTPIDELHERLRIIKELEYKDNCKKLGIEPELEF